MSSEEWRPVVGYDGFYEVSSIGRVRSLDRAIHDGRRYKGRILRQGVMASGHRKVQLCKEDHRDCLVHRLVLEAFTGPCPEGKQCCHNDGDPSNNRAENLRWDTIASNAADRLKHGTEMIGEKNPLAKLTADKVRTIFEMHERGITGRAIAAEFGVTPANISCVLTGKTWGHMGGCQ